MTESILTKEIFDDFCKRSFKYGAQQKVLMTSRWIAYVVEHYRSLPRKIRRIPIRERLRRFIRTFQVRTPAYSLRQLFISHEIVIDWKLAREQYKKERGVNSYGVQLKTYDSTIPNTNQLPNNLT